MEPRRSNFGRNPVRYGSWVGDSEQHNVLAFGQLPFRDGGSSCRSSRARYLQAVLDEKTRLAAAEQALRAAEREELKAKLQAERELSELRLAVEAAQLTNESSFEEEVIHARVEEWRPSVGSTTLPPSLTVGEQDAIDHLPVLPVPGRTTPVDLPPQRQTLSPTPTVGERNVVEHSSSSSVTGRATPVPLPRRTPSQSLTVRERTVVHPPTTSPSPGSGRARPVPAPRRRRPPSDQESSLPSPATEPTAEFPQASTSADVDSTRLENLQRQLEQQRREFSTREAAYPNRLQRLELELLEVQESSGPQTRSVVIKTESASQCEGTDDMYTRTPAEPAARGCDCGSDDVNGDARSEFAPQPARRKPTVRGARAIPQSTTSAVDHLDRNSSDPMSGTLACCNHRPDTPVEKLTAGTAGLTRLFTTMQQPKIVRAAELQQKKPQHFARTNLNQPGKFRLVFDPGGVILNNVFFGHLN